jgi:hypothetical protein
MVLTGGRRSCVCRAKPLPWASKTTRPVVTEAEANNNQWPIQRHIDGTVCVDMCLQCQLLVLIKSVRNSEEESRDVRLSCCARSVSGYVSLVKVSRRSQAVAYSQLVPRYIS